MAISDWPITPPRYIIINWTAGSAKDTTIVRRHTGVGLASDTTTALLVDLIAQLSSGGTEVKMLSPKSKEITMQDKWLWAYKGRNTLIQDLPGGWRATTPNLATDARTVSLAVGKAYQIKTSSNYYAKIVVDSLYDVSTTPLGVPTKKIVLRYAYQTAVDPYDATVGLDNF